MENHFEGLYLVKPMGYSTYVIQSDTRLLLSLGLRTDDSNGPSLFSEFWLPD